MITNLYVIFDSTAQIYNTPFKFINDQTCIRAATDIRRDPSTEIYKHPSDFTLFGLGTYDDTTAEVMPYGTLKRILHFHEIQLELDIAPEPIQEVPPLNRELG